MQPVDLLLERGFAGLAEQGLGWLWSCAALIVVLRALQLPLIAPIVAHRTPGPERVQALAARSTWRDIGAGAGPVLAGLLLPIASSAWVYGVAAVLLAAMAIACGRSAAKLEPSPDSLHHRPS